MQFDASQVALLQTSAYLELILAREELFERETSVLLATRRTSSAPSAMHMEASGRFERGDVVYSETPALFVQSAPSRSRTPTCGACGSPVGSFEAQLAVLAGRCGRVDVTTYDSARAGTARRDGPALPDIGLSSAQGSGCLCTLGCGELFCSDACEAAAMRSGAPGRLLRSDC